MSTLAPLIEAWDEGHREFSIAMGDFPDADLWKRPHARLLSAGELSGHIAYWQAVWTLGEGNDRPDFERLSFKSPLLSHAFRYYTTNVEQPFKVHLNAKQVIDEVMRIHEVAKAVTASKEKNDVFPGQWGTDRKSVV